MVDTRIAIVGAGIAGISAAHRLYQNGFKNFVILEAKDQIGGRIRSIKFDNNWIELGAQWIHGQQGNILYDFADKNELIADLTKDFGLEANGFFCTDDGDLIESNLVRDLIVYVDEKKEDIRNIDEINFNVFEYFRAAFDDFVRSRVDSEEIIESDLETINLLRKVFRWFIIYEVIDNSCDNLRELSSLSYIEWHNCFGTVDLINLKNGYVSVLNKLVEDFPFENHLRLNTVVERISTTFDYTSASIELKLIDNSVNSREENHFEYFDHVILTSSLGFLKANLTTGFFDFDLPDRKSAIIKALGFSAINKVYLYFDRPFWIKETKGFQILWSNISDQHSYSMSEPKVLNDWENQAQKFPSWVYCIQGFDRVYNQPNMLMAWIGSYGAKQIESLDDDEIAECLTEVLETIVPQSCRLIGSVIAKPSKIFCTRWNSEPYVLGSYSNRTLEYGHLCSDNHRHNIEILSEPLRYKDIIKPSIDHNLQTKSDWPLIHFAGEATDFEFYSTTHGAMQSGIREANRIIEFHRSKLKN
ncbi:thiamine pyrophosphokinase 1 [Sarcoptes scabiei]|uniref:Peroxisomal N(1)-acetyl-spermine/spermidine oxidase-like protein 2 n=1 Tax=Sarcoptes scabiei TaxID=52283 RepID=A0A132AJV3_SARSC|nr:peroxisomal N(1)-acetyl-spermine/spermidine oxidase-like protein 2 [Sarcoptes scabiei]UXI20325.1 thiamine pyrophosphokinase 1 [Sarcoptes scabiei]